MFKGKSLKKFFLASAVLIIGATALAGCTSKFVKSTKKFEGTAVNALNKSQVVQEALDVDFNDFAFLGADFNRVDSNNLDVDVSGVAKYNDGLGKAVVTMSYTLSNDYFHVFKLAPNTKSDKAKIIDVLGKAIETEEMKSFDFMELNDFAELNSLLGNFAQSPKSEFDFKEGLIFSLGNLNFNENEGVVSFDLKNHNVYEYSHVVPMRSFNPASHQYVTTYIIQKDYENCLHENQVKLFVTPEEMEIMKKDPKSVIDAFVEYVRNNKNDKYNVIYKNTENLSEQDTSNIEDFDMENC